MPPTINVDKRNPSNGKHTHFISISEDGIVNIWDTRLVEKEALKATPDYIWKPFMKIFNWYRWSKWHKPISFF